MSHSAIGSSSRSKKRRMKIVKTRLCDLNDTILWEVFAYIRSSDQEVLYQASDEQMKETFEYYWRFGVEHLLFYYDNPGRYGFDDSYEDEDQSTARPDKCFPAKDLQTLVLDRTDGVNRDDWLIRCQNIRQLTCSSMSICVNYRLSDTQSIECLTVTSAHFSTKQLASLTNLTHLECSTLTTDKNYPLNRLRSLDLNSFPKHHTNILPTGLTNLDIRDAKHLKIEDLIPCSQTLRNLTIRSRWDEMWSPEAEALPVDFPSLLSLTLYGVVNDVMLFPFILKRSKVRQLTLPELKNSDLNIELMSLMRNVIKMRGDDLEILSQIVKYLPDLTDLHVSETDDLDKISMELFCSRLRELKCLNKLKNLVLDFGIDDNESRECLFNSLKSMIQELPSLDRLKLYIWLFPDEPGNSLHPGLLAHQLSDLRPLLPDWMIKHVGVDYRIIMTFKRTRTM